MEVLKLSKIKPVWDIFVELSAIPRGSGSEKNASNWILDFCKKHRLNAKQDKLNNIFITKTASKGYEKCSPIILQGHIDMVNEKTPDSKHDFSKDAIKLQIKDGFLMADGTTLGADNGIGIAFILAFLIDESVQHPMIEAILTTEEETTMNGAKGFDYSQITGRRLVSLDHNREGEVLTACAGIVLLHIDGKFEIQSADKGYKAFGISLDGLKGGHSGNDIVVRASAYDFLKRTLDAICKADDVLVSYIECGSKPNAIARDFNLHIFAKDADKIVKICESLEKEFNEEILSKGEKLSLQVCHIDSNEKCVTAKQMGILKDLIIALPNGVQTMLDIPDTAESSLNIGCTLLENGKINFAITVRSSVKHLEESILEKLNVIASKFNLALTINATSPMFSSVGSNLAKLCMETYQKMFGKTMKEKRVHAIVEAGVLTSNIPGLDAVLIAPDLYDIHSPLERLDIASTERTWDFFVEFLKTKDQ